MRAFLLISIFLITSCSDKAQITYYDKSLKNRKLKCSSFSPNREGELESFLKTLYKFDNNCPYKLTISYKSKIVCNSSFNAYRKTTTNFPSAYLNLEIKKGFNLEYSYYIDLTSKPTKRDIKRAFNRIKDDILD